MPFMRLPRAEMPGCASSIIEESHRAKLAHPQAAADGADSRAPANQISLLRLEGLSSSMIRFLQGQDTRLVKAIFVVIIALLSVSMVVYLIPGLTGSGAASPNTFAMVYPHWYSRILSSGDPVSQMRVEQMARNELRQRGPQYANNPMLLQFFEQQVGQQMVQQQVLLEEADKLGVKLTDGLFCDSDSLKPLAEKLGGCPRSDAISQYLRTGPTGEVIFPG